MLIRRVLLGIMLITIAYTIYTTVIQKINLRKSSPVHIPHCVNCNVLFISIDPLRTRNIHVYGYKRPTTPTIDSLAAKGVLFKNTISVSSWTLPATMSLFTGAYPSVHRITNKYTLLESGKQEISNLTKLSPTLRTMAEVFKTNGYTTGGFTGGAALHRQFGFDLGFDEYVDDRDFAGLEYSSPKALDWIREHKNEKFFVFLHGFDTHGQYLPEEGYDKRFLDFPYKGKLTGSKEEQMELREEGLKMRKINLTGDDVRYLTALYDEKVARADSILGQFFKEYETLGLLDKTITVITSDHGEELYEHGQIDHGHSLYEELIQVPLIIVVPGLTNGVIVEEQVQSIDIMPTLISLTGITMDSTLVGQLQGRNIFSNNERNTKLDAYSETDYRYAVFRRALRTVDGWKIISDLENKSFEVFNLRKDSNEMNNLVQINDRGFEELKNKLRKVIETLSASK